MSSQRFSMLLKPETVQMLDAIQEEMNVTVRAQVINMAVRQFYKNMIRDKQLKDVVMSKGEIEK